MFFFIVLSVEYQSFVCLVKYKTFYWNVNNKTAMVKEKQVICSGACYNYLISVCSFVEVLQQLIICVE